jgi:hypothetical protein
MSTKVVLLCQTFVCWFVVAALTGSARANCIEDQLSAVASQSVVCCDQAVPKTIPTNIGNFSTAELKIIDLRSCSLYGTIPTGVGALASNLTALFLQDNALTGTLPTQVGQLVNLAQLWIYSNTITGTIDNSVFALSTLKYMYVQFVKLVFNGFGHWSLMGGREPLSDRWKESVSS